MRKSRSKEFLISIYEMRFLKGMKQSEIVEKTGYSSAEISLCFTGLRRHFRGEVHKSTANFSYREACKYISSKYTVPRKWLADKKVKENLSVEDQDIAEVKESLDASDEFTMLEESFGVFTGNIQRFIDIRVKKEVAKNDKKLQDLEITLRKSRNITNELQVENMQLRKIKEEAKNGNWINNLKKNWS